MNKSINKFKIGNLIIHYMNTTATVYDLGVQPKKVTTSHQETLLILARENDYFIVSPFGTQTLLPHRRIRFSHGGFDNCFKMLISYVNKTCFPVSV